MTTEEIDEGFIPSTDLIRNAYRALALRPGEEAVLVAEFDGWLRERDATKWAEGERAEPEAFMDVEGVTRWKTRNPYLSGLLTHEHPKGGNDASN